jgi:hypothetical protein
MGLRWAARGIEQGKTGWVWLGLELGFGPQPNKSREIPYLFSNVFHKTIQFEPKSILTLARIVLAKENI